MSRLIDLQRRLVEVGRIRLGTSQPGRSGGKLPVRLGTWRFTSRDEHRICSIAERYGGKPRLWEARPGEWEVVTERDRVPIALIPGQALSQYWELWGQESPGRPNVCLRRCDGERQMDDSPCACPGEYDERRELAQKGRACKPTSRLSVLLPEIMGIGSWRLETRGVYAAIELAGLVDLLEEITRRGRPCPAELRIDQRTVQRSDVTLKFPVPVIDVLIPAGELLALTDARRDARESGFLEAAEPPSLPAPNGGDVSVATDPPSGYTPLSAAPTGQSVASAVAQAQRLGEPGPTSARRAEPVRTPPSRRREGALPTPPDEGEVVEEETPTIPQKAEVDPSFLSDSQRRFVHARKRDLGLEDDTVRDLIEQLTGQRSTVRIPRDSLDELLALMEAKHIEQLQTALDLPGEEPSDDTDPDDVR